MLTVSFGDRCLKSNSSSVSPIKSAAGPPRSSSSLDPQCNIITEHRHATRMKTFNFAFILSRGVIIEQAWSILPSCGVATLVKLDLTKF